MNLKFISIAATAVLIALAFALVARGGLLGTGPISLSLQGTGLLLALWARLTFGLRSFHFAANPTLGPLVTSGPYRYIRNPIYSAALLIILTGVAVHWSLMNALLGALIAAMLIVRIACEEPLLRQAYPEYESYARNTARLVPGLI